MKRAVSALQTGRLCTTALVRQSPMESPTMNEEVVGPLDRKIQENALQLQNSLHRAPAL